MSLDQLHDKQQALDRRVLTATDWITMREYAGARIESLRKTMETCDPSELQKLQGQIAELRYLSTADETIRKKLGLSKETQTDKPS